MKNGKEMDCGLIIGMMVKGLEVIYKQGRPISEKDFK